MKVIQKNIVRSILALCLLATACTAYLLTARRQSENGLKSQLFAQSLYLTDTDKTGIQLQAAFDAQFNEREDALWSDIESRYGITRALVEQQRKQTIRTRQKTILQEKYKEGARTAGAATIELVQNVATTCGLDAAQLHIIAMNQGPMSPASANIDVVSIDETYFATYPRHEQEFIIAHELCHVIHGDPITLELLRGLMGMKRIDQTEIATVMNDTSRFFEERADVFAMTRNSNYVDGALDFCKKMDATYGLKTGSSHPKWIERYHVAQAIKQIKVA